MQAPRLFFFVIGLILPLAADANPYLMGLFPNLPHVVQAPSGTYATGTTNTVAVNPVQVGDLIVVGIATTSSSATLTAVTDNAGNSYSTIGPSAATSGTGKAFMYYAPVVNNGATIITAQFSSAVPSVVYAVEIKKMNINSSLEGSQAVNSPSASTNAEAALSTSSPYDFVFSIMMSPIGISSLTTTNFHAMTNANSNTIAAAFAIIPTPGTTGAVWSQSTSSTYCALTASFKASL